MKVQIYIFQRLNNFGFHQQLSKSFCWLLSVPLFFKYRIFTRHFSFLKYRMLTCQFGRGMFTWFVQKTLLSKCWGSIYVLHLLQMVYKRFFFCMTYGSQKKGFCKIPVVGVIMMTSHDGRQPIVNLSHSIEHNFSYISATGMIFFIKAPNKRKKHFFGDILLNFISFHEILWQT